MPPIVHTYQHFHEKFEKAMKRKILIGDIRISDLEYKDLLPIAKNRILTHSQNGYHACCDSVLALALVQIAARECHGRAYWTFVQKILGLKMDQNDSRHIGLIFIGTLKQYGCGIYSSEDSTQNAYVQNILIQAIIPDQEMEGLFDVVWSFYDVSLLRRMPESPQELTDEIKAFLRFVELSVSEEEETTSPAKYQGRRTLTVRKATKHVLMNYPQRSIRLIRTLFILIHKRHFGQPMPLRPSSRFTKIFLNWDLPTYEPWTGSHRGGGPRYYSQPHLHLDTGSGALSLVYPRQRLDISCEIPEEIKCLPLRVSFGETVVELELNLQKVQNGVRTIERPIPLPLSAAFDGITTEIQVLGGIKSHTIGAARYRYLGMDGDEISSPRDGGFLILAHPDLEVGENGVVGIQELKGAVLYHMDTEEDGIFRIGGRVLHSRVTQQRGLMKIHQVEGVAAWRAGNELPVYSQPPMLLLEFESFDQRGYSICIGDAQLPLKDVLGEMIHALEIEDGKQNPLYLLDTTRLECNRTDGVKSIRIERPATRFVAVYPYLLLQDATFEFDEPQYLFSPRAMLNVSCRSLDRLVQRSGDEVGKDDSLHIGIDLTLGNSCQRMDWTGESDEVSLAIRIPCLLWRMNGSEWRSDSPNAAKIWFEDFTGLLEVELPHATGMLLRLDGGRGARIESEYDRGTRTFRFDLDRCKDAFLSERGTFQVKLDIGLANEVRTLDFASVISRCYASLVSRTQDCAEGRITGRFHIIGKDPCHVSMYREGVVLLEDVPLSDSGFAFEGEVSKGWFRVLLHQIREDELGFETQRYVIFDETVMIDDRMDYSYSRFVLKTFDFGNRQQELGPDHRILLTKKTSRNQYAGSLTRSIAGSDVEDKRVLNCRVTYPDIVDPMRFMLEVEDDEEWTDFIYDIQNRCLVLQEPRGLSRHVKYTRYALLYPETIFRTDRLDEVKT